MLLFYFYIIHLLVLQGLCYCQGVSPATACRGRSSMSAQASHHGGLSCCGAQPLGSGTPVAVARGLSRSMACGFFPDQELNPCPLNRQANSCPLYHQESPQIVFNINIQKAQIIKVQTDTFQYINTKT